ncbi:MAG: hypothetical protein ACRDP4_13750, partial [Nocardioidaceae bacterium]
MAERGQPRPGEPMWTEEDRSLALEWQSEQDATCSGCGNPLDECMSPDHEGAYSVKRLVCHACKASAVAAADDQNAHVDA